MGWRLKLGTFAGIRVQVHFTFYSCSPGSSCLASSPGKANRPSSPTPLSSSFTSAVSLLLEFGHALTARRYGILTKDITLLPIGGVARLERMPDDPRQELWVALAGPAVNVVIAIGLWTWLAVSRGGFHLAAIDVTNASFVERLLIVNISLVVFNMLPAFPMDGGRVVRALLATRMDYLRATQIAANLGQGMALLFGLLGFLYNPMLIFIALFVWIGATQEASMVLMKSALSGIPVSAAMMTNFETVTPQDSLDHVSHLILSGAQQDFPVLDQREVVGVITRSDLLKALARKDVLSVNEIMLRDFPIAHASDMLETALQRLQSSPCPTMPVVQSGSLVGLLTAENLGEFLIIENARHQRPS